MNIKSTIIHIYLYLKIYLDTSLSKHTKKYMYEIESYVKTLGGEIKWEIHRGNIKEFSYGFSGNNRYKNKSKFLSKLDEINNKYDIDFIYIDDDINEIIEDIENS